MVQTNFLAVLALAIPALGANIQARENWGKASSSLVASPTNAPDVCGGATIYARDNWGKVTSSILASSGAVTSTVCATPAPTGATSTVWATPVPTSYFGCGGSNFTVTWGDQPTGVTTVTLSATGSAATTTASGIVTLSAPGSVATTTASGIVSSLLPRQVVISSVVGIPTYASSSAFATASPSSSFISGPVGTVSPSSWLSSGIATPIGTASSSAFVCPYPTSTVFATPTNGTVSSRPAVSGTSNLEAQLGQQGDNGAATGMAVSAGSVAMGAVVVLAALL